MRKAGPALPLLLHLCVQCGDGDTCGLVLHECAEATGVPKPTVKTWLSRLSEAGFIEKIAAGRDGLRIRMLGDLLGLQGQDFESERVARARDLIHAVASTVAIAMEKLQQDLGQLEGARS